MAGAAVAVGSIITNPPEFVYMYLIYYVSPFSRISKGFRCQGSRVFLENL